MTKLSDYTLGVDCIKEVDGLQLSKDQTWLTGSRVLDIAALPVVFALLFVLLRWLLVKYVYTASDDGVG